VIFDSNVRQKKHYTNTAAFYAEILRPLPEWIIKISLLLANKNVKLLVK